MKKNVKHPRNWFMTCLFVVLSAGCFYLAGAGLVTGVLVEPTVVSSISVMGLALLGLVFALAAHKGNWRDLGELFYIGSWL